MSDTETRPRPRHCRCRQPGTAFHFACVVHSPYPDVRRGLPLDVAREIAEDSARERAEDAADREEREP